jgi:ABC-type lipoprotein export system ATPase subunit
VRARSGMTVMVVSHSREIIGLADRSLYMRDGRLTPEPSRQGLSPR